jgi:hypothetical protein
MSRYLDPKIAMNMLKANKSLEEISLLTGLSQDEIAKPRQLIHCKVTTPELERQAV